MVLKPGMAVAYAPAAVGNVAVGYDLLGHALATPGDVVSVRQARHNQVLIDEITGIAGELPLLAEENSAGAALIAMRERLGLVSGFSVRIKKGIPLGSGMGGSAASAVAAVFAANALLDEPLAIEDLLPFALAGEAAATGTARCLRDVLIEPQRSPGIPGFADVQRAAMENSALGCSLSGSGPAVFAWCRRSDAKTIAAAMRSAFERSGLASSAYISAIDAPGVRLMDNENSL